MTPIDVLALVLGAVVVFATLSSAVHTFVLPRSAPNLLTGAVFRAVRACFDLRARKSRSYHDLDRVMALYAPVSLLVLPLAWLVAVTVGYTGIYWALGVRPVAEAFTLSGSSLLTLGFAPVQSLPTTVASFSEATIGLGLVALLIAYLPTMYTAFARREAAVTRLEVWAGTPPSAVQMIERVHRIDQIGQLDDLWQDWEQWFVDVEESHTSLAALVFFRSPTPDRSWVTAAGTVLDAAALVAAVLDMPRSPRAELCIRSGYIALRRVADYFDVRHNHDPSPSDPISITRAEFDAAYDRLAAAGIALKADRAQCWRDFAGWRVNYDAVLLEMAQLTLAPYAPWSSDRSLARQ